MPADDCACLPFVDTGPCLCSGLWTLCPGELPVNQGRQSRWSIHQSACLTFWFWDDDSGCLPCAGGTVGGGDVTLLVILSYQPRCEHGIRAVPVAFYYLGTFLFHT